MNNVDVKLVEFHRKLWLEERNASSLAWLYGNVIGTGNGPTAYSEVIGILGEPTHNQLEDNMTEYASPDGVTIILLHWSEDAPRELVACKKQ